MDRKLVKCLIWQLLVNIGSAIPGLDLTNSISNDRETNVSINASYSSVAKLYEDVLSGYDKRVRPRANQSEALNVIFLFEIISITEFDTASQKLSILGLFYFQWNDEILAWNPYNYGGIRSAKFPRKEVWSPTMIISKAFDGNGNIGDKMDVITYSFSGDATWAPEGIYDVICDVTTKFYPFDTQSCAMTLYVSDTPSSEVSLEPMFEGVSTKLYQNNSEWRLIGVYIQKIDYHNVHCYEFVVGLERRTDFILNSMVYPLILLSVLNIGIFIVPVDSGEKGSIAVTLVLSYEVFLAGLKGDLPHNSTDLPYFLIYIHILLWFSAFAVIYSFIESWIYANYAEDIIHFNFLRRSFRKYKLATDSMFYFKKRMLTDPNHVTVREKESSTTAFRENGLNVKVTWRKLMRFIDLIFFLVLSCVVAVSTTAFFMFISQRENPAF